MSMRDTTLKAQNNGVRPSSGVDVGHEAAWSRPAGGRTGRFGAMKIAIMRSEAYEQRVKDYCLAMQQRLESPRRQQRATELMLRWVQNDVRKAELDLSLSAKDYRIRLESILEHNYHLIESLIARDTASSDTRHTADADQPRALPPPGQTESAEATEQALTESAEEPLQASTRSETLAPTVLLRRFAQGLHPLEDLDLELGTDEEPISLESVGMPSDLQSLSDAVLLMKRLEGDARLEHTQVSSSVAIRMIDVLKAVDTSAWPSEARAQIPALIAAIEQLFRSRVGQSLERREWQSVVALMDQLGTDLRFALPRIHAFTAAHSEALGEDRQRQLNRLSNVRQLWENEEGIRLALATRAAGEGEQPSALGAYRGEVDDIQLLRYGREEALKDYLGVEPRWQEKLKRIISDQFSKYVGSASTSTVNQAFERLSEVIPREHEDAKRLMELQQSVEQSQLDEAALVVNQIRIDNLEALKQSVDFFSLERDALLSQADALTKHLEHLEACLPAQGIQAAVKTLRSVASQPASDAFAEALRGLSEALADVRDYLPRKLEAEHFSDSDRQEMLERSKHNHEVLQQLAKRWLGPHEAKEISQGMKREWHSLVSMIGSGVFGALSVSLTLGKIAAKSQIASTMISTTKDLLPLATGPISIVNGAYDVISGLKQHNRAFDAKQKCRLLQQHFAQRIDGRPIDADLARIAASLKRGQAYQAGVGKSKVLLGSLGITSGTLVTVAAVGGVLAGVGVVVGAGVSTLGVAAAVLGGIGVAIGVGVAVWKLSRWLMRRSEKNQLIDVIRRKPDAIAAYRKASPLRSFLSDEQIALQATHVLIAKSSRFAARTLIERLRFERDAMPADLFKESQTVQLLSVFYADDEGNPDLEAINALLQLSADEAMASFERKLQLRLT